MLEDDSDNPTVSQPCDVNSHRQTLALVLQFTTLFGVATLLLLGFVLMLNVSRLTEAAEVAGNPVEFSRPSAMEYVGKTNSCVVGGTVMSAEWHVDSETVPVGKVDPQDVDSTSFKFKSDAGREFTVSHDSALNVEPGESLGLELHCDPVTIHYNPSFGLRAIIFGGK